MLNWSRIKNILTTFRQPIGWAFVASVGIHTIVELDWKQKIIGRNWSSMLSVKLAALSVEEGDMFRQFALSKVMAMGVDTLPLASSQASSLKQSLVKPQDDPLINLTIQKAHEISAAFPFKLSDRSFHIEKQVVNPKQIPQLNTTESKADKELNTPKNRRISRAKNHKKTNQIPNQKPATELKLDMTLPIANEVEITSEFGWRLHPVFGNQTNFHRGIDFGSPTGTPVLAVYEGKVESADWQGGYGLTVILEHEQGTSKTKTLYAHLSKVLVKKGELVKPGDVIGHVGSTGYSTGPHLHFELRELTNGDWQTIDPTPRLQTAIAHHQQAQQRAWFEATILSREQEFYAWVVEFTQALTNPQKKQ